MTMDAAHLASPDLPLQTIETVTAASKNGDRALFVLRVDVVEIKDDRIGFSAIDTGMGAKIFDYIRSISSAIAPARLQAPHIVLHRIFQVVISQVQRLACFAVGVTAPIRALVELVRRQIAFALCATFVFITHGKAMVSKDCAISMALGKKI
jgi:hypothetical protein